MEPEHPEAEQTSGESKALNEKIAAWIRAQPSGQRVRIGEVQYELDYFTDKIIHDSNNLPLGYVIEVIDNRSYLGLCVRLHPVLRDKKDFKKNIVIPIDQVARVVNNSLLLRCPLDKLVTLPRYLELNREASEPRKSNFTGYLKIEVQIPEECLHSLMLIHSSPSTAITNLVINQHRKQSLTDTDPLSRRIRNAHAHGRPDLVPTARPAHRSESEQNHPVWDQDNFDKFILTLMESMETRQDIDELFSFLIAYGSGESNKPTAIQLKNRMSNQISESNPEIWNQHLRKCKARLTITAKNLNLPKPFGKPYGKSPNRKHPIDRGLLSLLIPWIDGSNERCQISLDDQSHEDSIEILREFTPPEFVIG